jgi:hypothetical protein
MPNERRKGRDSSVAGPRYPHGERAAAHPSVDALARQLAPDDELLVLCDRPTDPVAAAPPTNASEGTVEVVPVGNPDGCSRKANALAVGLEHASDELLVLTDDDVEHDADWLARLKRLARQHGAASATPAFVSSSPRWQLFEPVMLTLGSALLCRYGGAWGGGVAFERERIDEARFRAGLKRTVSDDALLWSMLETVHTTPTFVSRVRVPGGRKQVRNCIVRFMLTYRYFLPRWMALTNQSKFIAMLLGGSEYHHHIPETHAHMQLRDEHYDAVLGHLRTSLREHDVSNQYISQLMGQLEQYRTSTVTA